ncbi:MAG: hypothetical protein P4L40_04590 [Terracidiphilus sp.]|nr:hypothetical protein [Terracidiphilus sp.]
METQTNTCKVWEGRLCVWVCMCVCMCQYLYAVPPSAMNCATVLI